MEQENKKVNLQIIIPIVIAVVAVIIVGIIIKFEGSKQKESLQVSDEEKIIGEKKWQDYAKESEITSIMNSFTPESSKDIFDLESQLKLVKDENMYAQLFLDKYKNINYLELDEISRDFLNLYIKELFDDNNKNAYNSRNVKVVEAWKANYNGEIDNFAKRIMIKFENYPYQGTYDGAKYSYLVLKKENSTYEIDTEYYSNSIESNPNMNLTKNRGSIVCEKINVDDLNNLINEYDEFINFLLDYREEIYKPIQEQKKIEEDAKKEEEKQEKSRKPAVGMTQSEVLNGAWGMPDKKNKDTYSWGTTEQWVYNDKGYVYFRNGVVTSVSER